MRASGVYTGIVESIRMRASDPKNEFRGLQWETALLKKHLIHTHKGPYPEWSQQSIDRTLLSSNGHLGQYKRPLHCMVQHRPTSNCEATGIDWLSIWLIQALEILNSLAPGRYWCGFKIAIFSLMWLIGILKFLYDNDTRWMPGVLGTLVMKSQHCFR